MSLGFCPSLHSEVHLVGRPIECLNYVNDSGEQEYISIQEEENCDSCHPISPNSENLAVESDDVLVDHQCCMRLYHVAKCMTGSVLPVTAIKQ